jgi:GNAT superfamily N-acetyltransferase
MASVNELIETLWTEHSVLFETDYEEEFTVVLNRIQVFFDIVLYSKDCKDAMGFLTLKNEKEGLYSIVNDTAVNPHPTFVNTPGHGIEVKKKYRRKGIGGALLSLGIGVVQRHYKTARPPAPFRVVATDISKLGLGCYRSFGFDIKEGFKVSMGEYTDLQEVPELGIRPWKMPFLLRFFRRFR